MNFRENLRKMNLERKKYAPGTVEHIWRTNAARKYIWIIRGVPVQEWNE